MQKHSDLYAGVVFLSPMCKIADEMMPPQFVIDFCRLIAGTTGTASLIGYLPLAPSTGDLQLLTYRMKEKQRVYMRHPAVFKRKPRFATARELLVRCDDLCIRGVSGASPTLDCTTSINCDSFPRHHLSRM
jgi:hypothetical protein